MAQRDDLGFEFGNRGRSSGTVDDLFFCLFGFLARNLLVVVGVVARDCRCPAKPGSSA
jgi:hypothetical protein